MAGAVCAVLLLTATPALAQPKIDPVRGAPRAVACTGCHGSPSAPPPANMPYLSGQQAEFLVLQMFLFREGLRNVPEMKGLFNGWTDRDLEEVAAFFAAQPAPAARGKRDPKLYLRGAAISRAMGCGSCHLQNYAGQRQVPRLAGQREDYLAASMKAYRDNRRTGADTQMNAIMSKISDADIDALAHYFARP